MTSDAELLRHFAENHSEAAFAQLVARHLDLVYGVAVRRLGADKHLAEDVVQEVFVDLARKAAGLSRAVVLTGWLFTSARFAAARAARTESRRRDREQKALSMNKVASEDRAVDWGTMRPLLDDLIDKLPERDRLAVLLRFFEGRDYADIGTTLAISADGARSRVERALEKLQAMLARRGIASTAAALAGALLNQPALAVPTGLATSVTAVAMSAGTAGPATAGILTFMSMNKVISGIVAALAVAGGITLVVQHNANSGLRAEIESLRDQSAASAALRAENASLAKNARNLQDELEKELANRADLIRAREEIAALKRQAATARLPSGETPSSSADPATAQMIPTKAWTNAGLATPAASYETAMWAHRQADVDALARTITFGEIEKAKLDALFANLPEETRIKLGSPEKMLALIFAAGPDHAAFQILSQTPRDENTMMAQVSVQRADGSIHQAEITFIRSTDGWKMLVPDNEVASQIRKITGEPRPPR